LWPALRVCNEHVPSFAWNCHVSHCAWPKHTEAHSSALWALTTPSWVAGEELRSNALPAWGEGSDAPLHAMSVGSRRAAA
jgi:hypothetical protein